LEYQELQGSPVHSIRRQYSHPEVVVRCFVSFRLE